MYLQRAGDRRVSPLRRGWHTMPVDLNPSFSSFSAHLANLRFSAGVSLNVRETLFCFGILSLALPRVGVLVLVTFDCHAVEDALAVVF